MYYVLSYAARGPVGSMPGFPAPVSLRFVGLAGRGAASVHRRLHEVCPDRCRGGGQWSVLAQTVREWKATAAVYADPSLLRRLTEPLMEGYGPVPSPVEADDDAG